MGVIVKKKADPAKVVQATGIVSKTKPDGSEESTTEIIGHELISAPVAMIEVAVGLTRNLGNYESIKFHVGITMPSAMDPTEIEETYTSAKGWVDDKINDINAEVDTMLGEKG